MADLADRFGLFGTIGTGISVLNKQNYQFGINTQFYFGNRVKEDVLENLRTSEGLIIGSDGRDAIVFLRMRGIDFSGSVAKTYALKPNSRSGIKLGFGLGYSMYWIRIQDDSRSLTQASGDYKFGYDRKVGGISLNQFVGYQRIGKNKRLNFYAGLNFKESFTKSLRNFNFGVDPSEFKSSRLDLNLGLQVGMMLVFYKFDKSEEIYY